MAEQIEASRAIRRVTLWGAIINLVLAGLKVAFGTLAGSVALVADGVHSLSDLATDVFVVVGVFLGGKPPDESHPYGHGKFETFAAILVALALVIVGAGVAYQAGMALYDHEESFPGALVMAIAGVSIVAKEGLYQATRRVAIATSSPSVLANAWHHRSDALSSVAVLVGAGSGFFGWGHGDQLAGIAVGAMVIAVGAKLGFDCISELSEHAIDERDIQAIKAQLGDSPAIRGWHQLRTRRVGREAFIDLHIFVDPDMTVAEGHAIAHELERRVRAALATPSNFTIHVEPYDEARAARARATAPAAADARSART